MRWKRFVSLAAIPLMLLLVVSCSGGSGGTGGFSLSVSPASLLVTQGDSGTATVTINRTGGFSDKVKLSVEGLPDGVDATFDKNPVTTSTNLTLTAAASAPLGKAKLVLHGVSGTLEHKATLELTVTQRSGGETNGGIAGYLTVDGGPAIKLDNGQVVLLDRLDGGKKLRKQFPSPDEGTPQSLAPQTLPPRVDLRANQTPIKNQGGRRTCDAFATVAAIEAAYKRERGLTLDLSEQYLNHIQKMTFLPPENLATSERETQLGAWGGSGVGYELGWLVRLRFGIPEESVMEGIVAGDPTLTYLPWHDYESTNQDGDVPQIDWTDSSNQAQVDFWNLNDEPTTYHILTR